MGKERGAGREQGRAEQEEGGTKRDDVEASLRGNEGRKVRGIGTGKIAR